MQNRIRMCNVLFGHKKHAWGAVTSRDHKWTLVHAQKRSFTVRSVL